jgi:hypothetical protein
VANAGHVREGRHGGACLVGVGNAGGRGGHVEGHRHGSLLTRVVTPAVEVGVATALRVQLKDPGQEQAAAVADTQLGGVSDPALVGSAGAEATTQQVGGRITPQG